MSETNITFEYYYGNQANQFTFYRIPKQLFVNPAFKDLSTDAKVLYGLMIDRLSLSIQNGWKDVEDRIFIYFTLVEIQELINCGHNKAVRMLAELGSEKGIGLIKRIKQGLGKPAKIYVMNFLITENPNQKEDEKVDSEEVLTSQKRKSGVPKNGSPDFRKEELIKTDINQTDVNETEKKELIYQSINPSRQRFPESENSEIDRWMEFRDIFKKNIEYEYILQRDPEMIPEILEIMIETACSRSKFFSINGAQIPAERVRERLLSLNAMDIEYVLDALNQNTSKIQNIRAYLLATLYNAPKTINAFYKSMVNHDMYAKSRHGR
ncbi:MAG: DUF6017 domain-containing protein [Anaerolineaceae bacterium]|nr:DUF6017 domain-containing protein [Anaerolineaceae bacterium]MDD4578469.1 DUF6017 domain-containing protein [Anaerolineaceae bacterium]